MLLSLGHNWSHMVIFSPQKLEQPKQSAGRKVKWTAVEVQLSRG